MQPRGSNSTIGRCIYCGKIDDSLSREHIIPYGLNGELVLQKASCHECSDITSKFERSILRGLLPQARAALKYRTRRSHPKTFKSVMEINGVKRTVELTPDEYGAIVLFPMFRLPAYLEKRTVLNGTLDVLGVNMQRITGMDINELHRKYNAKNIDFRFDFNPGDFVKLLAKIAYGYSVFVYGIDALEENYVLPIIHGEVDLIDKWIGSEPASKGIEELSIALEVVGNELIAKIRLFGTRYVPTYIVVVGKIHESALQG